ncbi:butyrate kinase [Clostridium psychrophilum]|uniref:butyrate kinase n=1 Tax=Clostridium psychrophilum TaxID=132926 RepID=UPI001C0AC682|nr:butyrate kinase [Clostridium psychrophilum]MBU3182729.1 butyrate kinase [Clostridium psychrophilum]
MSYKLLVINPGSTSTKIGVYEDEKEILEKTIRHTSEEIGRFESILDQMKFRKDHILEILKKEKFDIKTLDAIVGRGGLLKSIEGGTYNVDQLMLRDLRIGVQGQHASNLGGIIASEIAKSLDIPAFIVDPVVVDEMANVARISGIDEIKRRSIFHALNQKSVAKRYAKEQGTKYEEISVIVAHMGMGVTVGAHKNGRVIDVNNGLDGEGPFSLERTGGLPSGDLARLCFSGKYTLDEILKKINGKGGFVAYLNTNDDRDVIKQVEDGDKYSTLMLEAMGYQIAKEIGSCAVALSGKVDAIILTGGVAYGKFIVKYITDRVKFIAKVVVYPGEDDLFALAQGGLRVLNGQEKAKEYK